MSTGIPPGVDLTDDLRPNLFIAIGICYPIAVIAVITRMWARFLMKQKLWLDDYFIIASLAANTGFMTACIVMAYNGMGRHVYIVTPEQMTVFLKAYIPGSGFYSCTISWTKLSILAFYWRMFSPINKIRPWIYSLGAIVIAWNIAVFLLSIFPCRPVAYWWDRSIPNGVCIDTTAFLLGNSIPNICTDIAIFVLPLPFIWKLNQSVRRKLAVCGIFLLAAFVCIITMVRLGIQINIDFNDPDLTWNITNFVIWTNVETSTAIISACLPMLKPLFVAASGRSSQPSSTNQSGYIGNSWRRQHGRLHDASATSLGDHSKGTRQSVGASMTSAGEIPLYEKEPTTTNSALGV